MAPRTGASSAIGKALSGTKWTDAEKLCYLFILLEHSGTKIQWSTAPIPTGRTRIACERMYGGLRVKLQDEIKEMLENATTAKDAKALKAALVNKSKSVTPIPLEDDEEPEQAPVTKGRKRRAGSAATGATKPKKSRAVKIEEVVDEDDAA